MPDGDPLDRLPHAGEARLPGRVLELVPSTRVTAERRLAEGDACLNAGGYLPAALMVELVAQVGGLLIGPAGGGPGDYAVLAGIRRMHIHGAARAGETVTVECSLARRLGELYLIECRGRAEGAKGVRDVAHGTIQIRRIRQAAAGPVER